MLGGRGVGKTSLLTAMYDQFNKVVGEVNLQLTPDRESSARLAEKLGELRSLFDDFEVTPGTGVLGTSEKQEFTFGIGKRGKAPSLNLRFVDYPGGYIASHARQEDRDEIHRLLKESPVVLVAIDAVALMEKEGRWDEAVNRTQQICDMFKENYQDLNGPRMVLFTPVKCETYVQDEKSALRLRQRIKEQQSSLLNLLSSEALQKHVVVAITPVQTTGTVVFSRMQVEHNIPFFYFRKKQPDSVYRPQDSEQPLRYMLRFLLKLHHSKRSEQWGFLSFVREWLGMDKYLVEAVENFAKKCKDTRDSTGFEVVQGKSWLTYE